MKSILAVICSLAVLSSAVAEGSIEGAWVLSERWTGFMGIAIVINGSDYRYWFYSDVRMQDEPRYPIRGKATFRDGVVTLTAKEKECLYDSRWHIVTWKGQKCLLADWNYRDYEKTGKMPEDRLLFRIADFDPKKPVMNVPSANDE